MTSALTVGVLYVLPLILWLVFLLVVVRVLLSGALEDSLGYLVILRRRRNEFVALLAILAVSQIAKDAIQVVGGLGSLSEGVSVLLALVLNIIGAGALFAIAWALLRPKAVTPAEDRLLSTMAESLYVLGKPEEFAHRPQNRSK